MGRAKRGGLAMKRLREERKAERRRSKAWKTRDRQRKADAEALADVLESRSSQQFSLWQMTIQRPDKRLLY